MSPTTLGDFELERPIGVGAQGRVWRATHRRSGLDAAVKVVGRSEGRRTHSWAAELNALARLDHPNIARIHDYGLLDEAALVGLEGMHGMNGAAWLAMEYCPQRYEHRVNGLTGWSDARDLIHAVLDGLAHAHARGVVHRDLKPANLLVGGDGRIKLVDFGIAILDGAALHRARGTPAYMAPEQFTTEPTRLGPWTDLYSLGIVIWHLVTGMRPFPRLEPNPLLQRKALRLVEPFLPRFDVPDGLYDLLLRLLHPRSGSRYLCAADLRHALDALGDVKDGSATEEIDATALPTVSELDPTQETPEAIPPLPPIPAAPRPTEPPSPTHRPWPNASLARLRDKPLVGRYDDRVLLWRHLDPGARVVLTGQGARALAGWAVRALRETCGHVVVEVEGHPGDPPGAALLRLVDEMLGMANARDPVRAGIEAIGRYRVPTADEGVDPVLFAVHTLLGGRSQTTPIRHGALVALLDALTRQRGAILIATGVQADPDLEALIPRLARAIPDLVLVQTAQTDSPEVPESWTSLHIPGPSHAEAVDAITHTGLTPRQAVAQLARHDDLDHALDATPLEPLAGLKPSERHAVERAAVLGPVDRAVWARMVELQAGERIGLEDELVRRGVARRRSGGWVFRDEVFRETLIHRLAIRDELEDAYAAAASALEALDDDPLRRGRLWLSAGRPEQALRTWLRQADRIEDEHGRRRSVELWGTARVVAHELPLAPDVHGEIDTRYLCGMVMLLDRRDESARLAEVTRLTFEQRGWNRAAALCCWVQAVAAGVSEPEAAMQAVEDGLALVEGRESAADVEGRLWGMRFRLSHEQGTREHMADMEHARDALSTQSDARSRLLFHRMAGLLAQARDDRKTALLHFAAQVEIARHARPRALPESIVQYAAVLAAEGRADEAEPLLEEALELAEFGESAHQAAYAAINLMTLALKRDAFGRAATMAARVLDYAAYSPHAALACDIGLALVAVGLDDPAAEHAWDRARAGLTAPHSPEADFVEMLDRIAFLATDPIETEAAELAAIERAALADQQRA